MNIVNIIRRIVNLFKWNKSVEIDYEKRYLEMKRMREEEGHTDTEIGKRFGITRERVRQILGNKGRDFRTNWTKKLISSGSLSFNHRSELESAPGIKREWIKDWGKHRHPVRGGTVKIGFDFEERASVILAQNGINNILMPNQHPYDIETESGIRIEVTVSNVDVSKMKTQVKSIYPTFAVPVRRRDCWDFLFAFVPDPQEESGYAYYVFPSWVLDHLKTEDARIRIPHPQMGCKPSKWNPYCKNIETIKNYTV